MPVAIFDDDYKKAAEALTWVHPVEGVAFAVASEREQCAKVAEGTAPIAAGNFFAARRDQCAKIAAKIRALSNSSGEQK